MNSTAAPLEEDVRPVSIPARDDADLERLRAFGAELDRILRDAEARIGEEDLRYIRNMHRVSVACEVAGRGLIWVSLDPFTFGLGVLTLFVHKQLQFTELGHSVLHGIYDKMPGAERFHSKTYKWKIPIEDASWQNGHNLHHHSYTNVAERDPDIRFGTIRLTQQTPHKLMHYTQLPVALLCLFPNFMFLTNLHFTGVFDAIGLHDRPDFLPDRSRASQRKAFATALRKYLPYYGKEYVLLPLLAGPGFAKVAFGNWLSGTLRDIYSASAVFCSHIGIDAGQFPPGTKARNRAEWYAMQIEATNDFYTSRIGSYLWGALDLQIEHHLFPRLPNNRLREIAPLVEDACKRHGVTYTRRPFAEILKRSLTQVARASVDAERPLLRRLGDAVKRRIPGFRR